MAIKIVGTDANLAVFPGIYAYRKISTNEIVYIGLTSVSIIERNKQHSGSKGNNVDLAEIDCQDIDKELRKHPSDYQCEVICANEALGLSSNRELLYHLEAHNIKIHNTKNNGFNKTIGNHTEYEAEKAIKKILQNDNSIVVNWYLITEDFFINKLISYKKLFELAPKSILLIGKYDDAIINFLRKHLGANVVYIEVKFEMSCSDINGYSLNKLRNNYSDQVGDKILKGLDSVKNTHFDLIISNPPYGGIGNEITKNIIDNFSWDSNNFINLLPSNDYKKDNLWRHVERSSVDFCFDGFADASITPMVCHIKKNAYDFSSYEDFDHNTAKCVISERVDRLNLNDPTKYIPAIKEYINKPDSEFMHFTRTHSSKLANFAVILSNGGYDSQNGCLSMNNPQKDLSTNVYYNIYRDVNHFTNSGTYPTYTMNSEKERVGWVKFAYSEDGLKLFKIINCFAATGNYNHTYAKIDYSKVKSIDSYFNKIKLSEESVELFKEMLTMVPLTDKEKEICEIVRDKI